MGRGWPGPRLTWLRFDHITEVQAKLTRKGQVGKGGGNTCPICSNDPAPADLSIETAGR